MVLYIDRNLRLDTPCRYPKRCISAFGDRKGDARNLMSTGCLTPKADASEALSDGMASFDVLEIEV